MVLITNEVTITNLNNTVINQIKSFLTINNPLFNQRLEMGLVNWGIPSKLKYYKFDPKVPNQIIVPVGSLPDLINKSIITPTQEEIVDNRLAGITTDFFSKLNFTGTLRAYQENIVSKCMEKTVGVIEAMTGSGKTITFIKLIFERKVPTLILVNTVELAEQTRKVFLKFTNATNNDIGFIGSGQFNLAPITICLHQTMAHLNDEKYKLLNNTYGMVIADEVHIVAAKTYYETMNKLKAKYKYGFSATLKRTDGLTPVIYYATGPKIYTVPKDELNDHLITPSIKYVNTEYFYPLLNSAEYQEMISDLSTNETRNKQIVEILKNEYLDSYAILLCARIEQVNILVDLIGPTAVAITSKTKKKERKQAMQDLNTKIKRHVVSTYGLFSTGIDIPHMNSLFLCAPIKSEIKVRQSAGRLMRKSAGKITATIVDFIDTKVELLKYQAYTRKKILEKL